MFNRKRCISVVVVVIYDIMKFKSVGIFRQQWLNINNSVGIYKMENMVIRYNAVGIDISIVVRISMN